jgi:hypothetical protein
MKPELIQEEEESECQQPCDPDVSCDECAGYWERMINEGFWDLKNHRWTDKGWREFTK